MPRQPKTQLTIVTSGTNPNPSPTELNPQTTNATDQMDYSSLPIGNNLTGDTQQAGTAISLPLPNNSTSDTQQAMIAGPFPTTNNFVEPSFSYATERNDIHYTQIKMPNDHHKKKILYARIQDMFPAQIKNASAQTSYFFWENMHFLKKLQNNSTFIQDVLTKPFDQNSSHIVLINNIHQVFEHAYANQKEINLYLQKAEPTSFFTRSIAPIVNQYGIATQNMRFMLESIKNGYVKNSEELKKNMNNIICLFDSIEQAIRQISSLNFQYKNSAIHDNKTKIMNIGIKYPEQLVGGLILDNMYDLLYRNEDATECVKIAELTIYIEKILYMELCSYVNFTKKQLSPDSNTFPPLEHMTFFQSTMLNRLSSLFDMIEEFRKNHLGNKAEESISLLLKTIQSQVVTMKFSMDSLIAICHEPSLPREMFDKFINLIYKLYDMYKEQRTISYEIIKKYLNNYPKFKKREIFYSLQKKGYISNEISIEFLQNPSTLLAHELYHSAVDNICKEMGVNLQGITNNNG
jgi:hypothetical protein